MSEFPPRGALTVSYGEACDRGKVREENQDSIRSAAIALGDLFIVADGIGGYQGGATASRMVVDGFLSQLAARPANYPPDHALAEACTYTNASIHAAANTGDPAFQRMGSTVVLALVQPGAAGGNTGEVASFGPNAWIGHVGDSRAYLIRGGQMTKITNDHSAVQALISRNLITEEEARNHPDASVLTRSLGHRPDVEIEIDRVPLQGGDSLLLCSDGLWGYVADADIAAVATDPNLSVEKIAEYLLDLALSAGGHDNIGIEFLRIGGIAPTLVQPIPSPSRTQLRSTVPDMGALASGPFAASAPPSSSDYAATSTPEPPKGNRRQILLAVCLLALAVGGALGLLARSHWKSTHKQDNSGNGTSSGSSTGQASGGGTTVVPAPGPGPGGKRVPKPPVQPQGPGPTPTNGPAQDANVPRVFGIVGEIELGPFRPPAPDEIALQHTVIRQEKKDACTKLATTENVAYISKPDLTERIIVDAIVKSYPKAKDHVHAQEVQRRQMTPEVRAACGSDYDAIVILAVKAPPQPGGNDAPVTVPHPAATTHDHAASQYHPHGGEVE
jgi:serine/threonine protein phosphatase PrpC